MLDVFHAHCEAYANTEGTMIVDVEDWELFADDSGGGLGEWGG